MREFYCNMFEVIGYGFKTYVRGQTLFVDANKIAKLLNLRRLANPSYHFPNPDNIEVQKEDMASLMWRSNSLEFFCFEDSRSNY